MFNEEKYTLIGVDGNAFCIMGYVSSALKRAKCSRDKIDEYIKEATSGNYDNLVQVSMRVLDELINIIE